MYIDWLRIEDFRCFGAEQVDLSFDRGDETYAGWTVFAGLRTLSPFFVARSY